MQCNENEVVCTECGDITDKTRDDVVVLYSDEDRAAMFSGGEWLCVDCLDDSDYEPYMDGDPLEHQEDGEFFMYVKELDD